MLLSLRFPLVAAVASLLVLGPRLCALLTLIFLLLLLAAWAALRLALRPPGTRTREDTIAFFHPNAAGGGGGERVLWCAVAALQRALPRARVLVLCDEKLSARELRERAARGTFGVELPRDVEVVPLADVGRLSPARHPRLTLVSQSLAGAVLAFQGLRRCCSRGGGGGDDDAATDGGGGGDDGGGSFGIPALFIDTSGWSLSHFVARAAGCRVAAYVHYPIVSSDMLRRVGSGSGSGKDREEGSGSGGAALAVAGGSGNGGSGGSGASFRSRLRSWAKTAYYHAVAAGYGAAGGACDVAMANSSWTAGHLEQLWWRRPKRVLSLLSGGGEKKKNGKERASSSFSSSTIVYPPCGVSSLQDLPLERAPLPEEVFGKKRKKGQKEEEEEEEGKLLVALAQFRPEKNQAALLRAFALARRRAAEKVDPSSHPVLSARLALVGGVRDAADAGRVEALRELAAELGLAKKKEKEKAEEGVDESAAAADSDGDAVVFVTNAPRETLRGLLASALGGLHAMVDEHFGICVVEYMSAGVVPVAHDSAGPRMDIVRDEEEVEEEGEEEEGEKKRPQTSASTIPTGFLCSTEEGYADAISELLLLSSSPSSPSSSSKAGGREEPKASAALKMAAAARRRARRLFSDERFEEGFLGALAPLLARVERGCRSREEEEKEKKKKKKKKR